MAKPQSPRSILIGNVSGSTGDRLDSLQAMLKGATRVDAITGDWLSEFNLASRSLQKASDPSRGYEPGFLLSFKLAVDDYLSYPNKSLKIVVNAGGLNSLGLVKEVADVLKSRNAQRKIAYVTGDDLLHKIDSLDVAPLTSSTGSFSSWRSKYHELLLANAYIGCWGIVQALSEGADIVICGRCTDASPVMGLAAWWHGWQSDNVMSLSNCLAAGHLIECGPYVCGGNFGGFKGLMPEYYDLSYPIAEIAHDGTSIIQKQPGQNGIVSIDTVRGQFLYELQGNVYFNPDVIADFTNIAVCQLDDNRVSVSGATGYAAPESLKLAVMAVGGYQAELSVYITGLDAHAKAMSFETMTRRMLSPLDLTTLQFQTYGTIPDNPLSQLEATVQLRVFAQAKSEKTLSASRFLGPVMSNQLQGFPALTPNHDFRTAQPKMIATYFPGLIHRSSCEQEVCIFGNWNSSGQSRLKVPEPSLLTRTGNLPVSRDFEPLSPVPLHTFGATTKAALGRLVFARSGDKGSNVNIGFFCPGEGHLAQQKWDWLRCFFSKAKLRELLGNDISGSDRIERCEFPKIKAVHFVLHGILGAGVSSTSKMDSLGKNVAEFVRTRHVDIPQTFLFGSGEQLPRMTARL